MVFCEKHQRTEPYVCSLCREERRQAWEVRIALYTITLTDAKKRLKGITTEKLCELVRARGSDWNEYDGAYGRVMKFRAEDIDAIAREWVVPDEFRMIQREKARITRARMKARDALEFVCEACGGETIRARLDSSAYESYISGGLERDKAIELLKNAHYRHCHTDYDETRRRKYEKNRRAGLSWEDAHYEARHEARKRI